MLDTIYVPVPGTWHVSTALHYVHSWISASLEMKAAGRNVNVTITERRAPLPRPNARYVHSACLRS